MYIERIQVEEGFLNGLDLRLKPGLNAIIGARGTGKTSIIELIRFCLGILPLTDRVQRVSYAHAQSVLQGGQVTLTAFDPSGQRIVVTRGAQDTEPRSTANVPNVAVLGPGEIEAVGLEAAGRLRLLDLFHSDEGRPGIGRQGQISMKSLSSEISTLWNELDSIDEQLESLASVPVELKEAEAREAAMLASVASTAKDQEELRSLQSDASALAVRDTLFQRLSESVEGFHLRVSQLVGGGPIIEPWPDAAGDSEIITPVQVTVDRALHHLHQSIELLRDATDQLTSLRRANAARRLLIENRARAMRQQLEELQQGAGALTRIVSLLREKAGQLAALTELRSQKVHRLQELQEQRRRIYLDIQKDRETRYENRLNIARHLNSELGPRIRIDIHQSEMDQEYVSAIIAGLRGSALHYNNLAPLLAAELSPGELVEAIEDRDPSQVARLANIPVDRAARVVAHLRDYVDDLLTADIEDGVILSLLTGDDYRSELSTGQRCTVVLSILLAHHGQVLVVDQPEDNLDNAFVTDTLVKAIRNRKADDQLIFATHNANIPVLGEADMVVLLESDGRRGYVKHAAELDDAGSVAAITTVMEGGIEAFQRRAEFYARFRHG